MPREKKPHEYNTGFRASSFGIAIRTRVDPAWMNLCPRMPPTALLPPICLAPGCHLALEHPFPFAADARSASIPTCRSAPAGRKATKIPSAQSIPRVPVRPAR